MIDVFKVGVHIGMSSNATHVLSSMLHQLTGVHIAANKVSGALGAIRIAAIGAAGVFAGWQVIKGLGEATKHAEKLNHELVKLQVGARLTDKQTDDAKVLAFKVTRDVKGAEVHETVKQQRELFGVFGNMDAAREILPMVSKGSMVTSNFVDKHTDLAAIAVRALELRGHITKDHKVDPAEFAKEFDAMVRSIVASEGLVDPAKLFQFIKQAGPAARTMTTEEMWGYAPAIMNALGAERSGTAMMSFYQQMVGHVVAGKRVAVAMEEAGMLKPGSWRAEKGGKVIMDRDAVVDQDRATTNPIEWVHERMEALRKRRDKDGNKLDEVGIIQRIFQFASRQTTARFISDIDANWPIIENELHRFKRTPGIDTLAKEQNEKDLSVNIKGLSASWDNFLAALGGPGIPIAIKVLDSLTQTLNLFQETIIRHPDATAALFTLAGGIGALTAIGGALAILNVAWAPLAGGLALLTGVPGLPAAAAGVAMVARSLTILAAAVPAAGWLDGKMEGAKRSIHDGIFGQGQYDASQKQMKDDAFKWFSDHNPFSPNMKTGPDLNERLRRGRPGYDADGKPLPSTPLSVPVTPSPTVPPSSVLPKSQPSPFVAPTTGDGTGKRSGDVYLDGKKVGLIIEKHSADRLSRPQSGPTGADYRVTPLMPGRVG